MSVKSGWQELYVGKTEANIIGFIGRKTKIQYSELTKIEYSYFRIGIGGGYLRFIDKNRKTKEFSFNHKNNEQITRTVDFIAENNPNLEIIQYDAKDLKFYQRTWFIILLMFCCCFPLGLFLMWYYRKLSKSIMILTTVFFIVMYSLGIYAGYQNYASLKNEWDTTFEQVYGTGQTQKIIADNASVPTSDASKNSANDATSTSEESSGITMGQKNALKSAQDYLDTMAFSHDGLIKQLKVEGYTDDDATYAADNCGADWKEQAAKSAQDYLDIMAFSRDGLIKQLEVEGYTSDQAEYAASAVGY